MSNEIMKQGNGALQEYEFSNVLNPEGAIMVANTIREYATGNGLMVKIQNRDYPQVEAWQYAGLLLGLFPRVVSVENQSTDGEIKYRAEVEIVNTKTGEKVGGGIAVCSNKEGKKKYFEEYAICSMAQTRATGKAFRLLIGWMFKLAGLETTPAEEMEEHDPAVKGIEPTADAVRKEYRKFALRALEACTSAKDVETLVKLAPMLKDGDAEFIDRARNQYKKLSNVAE